MGTPFRFFVYHMATNVVWGFDTFEAAQDYARAEGDRSVEWCTKLDYPLPGNLGPVTHQWRSIGYINGQRSNSGWSDYAPLWLTADQVNAAIQLATEQNS